MSKETECTGKRFYLTYAAAKRAAKKKNSTEYSKLLRSYKCNYCYLWHHTTTKKIEPKTPNLAEEKKDE